MTLFGQKVRFEFSHPQTRNLVGSSKLVLYWCIIKYIYCIEFKKFRYFLLNTVNCHYRFLIVYNINRDITMIKSGIDKIIKQAGGLQKISPELYALSENYKSIQKAISPCIESIQIIQSLISPKIQQYALVQQRFIQAFSSPL